MNIHVLGCHGPYPISGGATSGYLVENGGQTLLMDCGSGCLGKLLLIADPACLSGILLSHLHYDHAADLLVMSYYLQQRGAKLPVYIPAEDQSPLRAILAGMATYDVQPYPEKMEICGLTITTFPVRHPVPCRAIRLEGEGKTLVFTGDTNTCPGLEGFAKNCDALLCDAAFLEGEWKETLPHLSAKKAAELAASAGAGQCYLTHLPVGHDAKTMVEEACLAYPEARAVCPGMVIRL